VNLQFSNGNGGDTVQAGDSYLNCGLVERDRQILLDLHAKLDRVGELLLDARKKHEAEVARRESAAYRSQRMPTL
jgi:hypothetical protein